MGGEKMTDELSQLCPIQFIEGINENEKLPIIDDPYQRGSLEVSGSFIAISYEPSKSYTLTNAAVFALPHELPKSEEHKVKVYTDYEDNPSQNCLIEGKMTVPAEANGRCWLSINLSSLVVFRGQRYWLALEDYSLKFQLVDAKSGTPVDYRQGRDGTWISPSSSGKYFMIKFYGRVLPVA
jgi:hypothetical protein